MLSINSAERNGLPSWEEKKENQLYITVPSRAVMVAWAQTHHGRPVIRHTMTPGFVLWQNSNKKEDKL